MKSLWVMLLIFLFSFSVQANENSLDRKKQSESGVKPIPEPVSFVKEFSAKFNGKKISYRAVAGETYIRGDNGKPTASFFTTAYLKNDVKQTSTRPVTFIFNGGPGSSSAWLHMGAFGPQRVALASEPEDDGAAPYLIVDNPETILDVSDLVFIDPIGTGYSRVLGNNDAKEHWGLMEDANSVADFIQTWISENNRWNSPKYIAGESYGTARAALVADILSSRFISLNGIALISAVLDYQNSRPQSGGIMGFAGFLPTMAATAWYHGKINQKGKNFKSFVDEVSLFARTDYAKALIAGNRLDARQRTELVARISAYTGLSETYVEQSNLRILVNRFYKELLRDKGLVVGRLDGRYTGSEVERVNEFAESDPTFNAIGSAYNTAINVHLSETLDVKMNRPYKILGGSRVSQNWNWRLDKKTPNGGRFINVVPNLGRAMRHNKDLKVLVASGYYDFATPFFGAENALSQDGVVADRITYTYYKTGHMIFLDEANRKKLLADVRSLITGRGQ